MKKQVTIIGSGSTGLADALKAALAKDGHDVKTVDVRKPYSEAPNKDRTPVLSKTWPPEDGDRPSAFDEEL